VRKSKKGFTLIELMIVIAIIAILAAILVPNFLRARAQGQLTACKSNLKNIGTAMEMYSSDNQGRYPSAIANITPSYLKTLPTCAAAGQMTYTYIKTTVPDCYTAYCAGSYHTPMTTANYPQYDAVQGLYEK
jgi:type II secretion system protein G